MGYIIDAELGRLQMPVIYNPSPVDVDIVVSRFSSRDRVACLCVKPAPKHGPYELNLYADSGNCFLMLNQHLDDGEHEIRVIDNPRAEAAMIDVLGDFYPANAMTRSIELICVCFKEFLNFGDVRSKIFRVD